MIEEYVSCHIILIDQEDQIEDVIIFSSEDVIIFCSDFCAQTHPNYEGWYGCAEQMAPQWCESCGEKID